ncbi:MAG: LysR family transcriptional regulator [Thermodesulfobacteria bacterium]|nr:LysR family transcriptional regulator [Thermodesulfobacteriota bacterium]
MLDLRKLAVFVAVIEEESFSRAAQKCHLSQPTVSGHIKSLEDYFQVPLFDRHTREVRPTRAGQLLYRYAKRLLKLSEELEREMRLFAQGGQGVLFLGGSTIPGQYILPGLLGSFKREYPAIKITLKVADTQEIARQVALGELDLGVVGAKIPERELDFEPLWEDKIVLIASPRLFKEPCTLSLRDLVEIPLLVREEGSGTWLVVQEKLREEGLSPEECHIVAELGSTEAVKQGVKAGLGAAFVSEIAVEEDLERGSVLKLSLPFEIERYFYLITPRHHILSPVAQIFVDFCRRSD